jgi:hypothetical protein
VTISGFLRALTVVLGKSDLIDKLGVVCAVKGAGPQREGIPEVTKLLKPLV